MTLVSASNRRKFFTLLLLSVLGFASNSRAQEPASVEDHSTVEPSIDVEWLYDDNIFRSPADKQSSLLTTLSPGLLAIFVPSKHRFELEYDGEFASYAESSADDYDDHEFRASAHLELGLRSKLDIIGSYEDAHQNRGTGLSEGFDPESSLLLFEPDEYQRAQFDGKFTYGATGTRGRLVFEAGHSALEYNNNRDRTRFFDYDNPYGGLIFYFRVMPNTSLLLDVRATEYIYNYERVLQPSLESAEYRYLIGATWDVTGKTTGTVKFGYVEKKYDNDARPKFSDASWEVEIRWSPRTYSYFDFSTRRYPSEVTSETGDVIDNTTYSMTWSHAWSDRIMTRLTTGDADQDFRGSTGARVQERKWFGFTLAYKMRRWLTWEFGVNVSAQEGNIDRFDFDSNIARLGANFTF